MQQSVFHLFWGTAGGSLIFLQLRRGKIHESQTNAAIYPGQIRMRNGFVQFREGEQDGDED